MNDLPLSIQLAMAADEAEAARIPRCRHGETGPHGYGMEDEPDYDGGEIFAIPSEKVIEETKTEEEWLSACLTTTFTDLATGKRGPRCDKPAVVNVTLVCPFCGPTRTGKCEDHFKQAIAGKLFCAPCSIKAKTEIYKQPLNCVWKSE